MTADATFVFVLIGVAAALMASNRVRFDFIALLVVLALILSGVLSVGQALSGFGSSVVILVACLLVVGEMLDRTGVAVAMGNWILQKGGSNETRLLIVIMAGAAVLGAVMSSTAVVAIFIPIILRIAAETSINPSRMLMPMSYAALISGMLTLIATTPNLVVSEELKDAGFEGFGFFSFSPVGVAVLVVAIGYILLLGRRLLPPGPQESKSDQPGRTIDELWEDFRCERVYHVVQMNPGSPLTGKSISETDLATRFGARVVSLVRGTEDEEIVAPLTSDTLFHDRDVLLIIARSADIERLLSEQSLTPVPPSRRRRQRWLWVMGGAAVLIHPESRLIGKSLRALEFRTRYGLEVLGLRRQGKPTADFEDVKLAASDSLFVLGSWKHIQQLQTLHRDFVVLELPSELADVVPAYRRMPVALLILAAMVLLTIFEVVPLVAAVIMAAMAAVVTRCLTMEDSYRAIHWSSLVLVAGMLPLADALDQTGGTDIVVDALMSGVGDSGPMVMLTAIFFLTAALGLFLSNTAAAVLVAPIAIHAADELAVSPYPFAVAVLIAASAAFVTPVSTPVVTLVVEPGRYGFMDFVKVGVPLLLLTYVVTLLVAPQIFPFSAQ